MLTSSHEIYSLKFIDVTTLNTTRKKNQSVQLYNLIFNTIILDIEDIYKQIEYVMLAYKKMQYNSFDFLSF